METQEPRLKLKIPDIEQPQYLIIGHSIIKGGRPPVFNKRVATIENETELLNYIQTLNQFRVFVLSEPHDMGYWKNKADEADINQEKEKRRELYNELKKEFES